jgi:Fur family ferric uptake transcriptional regulator
MPTTSFHFLYPPRSHALPTTLLDALRARGLRVTPQRAIILEAIEQLPGHMTAEQIYTHVQQVNSYINLATIYRTLELLLELDLMTEADMGTGATAYALHTHATHHHAVCRSCGRSFEFSHELFEPLTAALCLRYAFVADVDHTVIFGWCQSCTGHPQAAES